MWTFTPSAIGGQTEESRGSPQTHTFGWATAAVSGWLGGS